MVRYFGVQRKAAAPAHLHLPALVSRFVATVPRCTMHTYRHCIWRMQLLTDMYISLLLSLLLHTPRHVP